MPSQVHRYYHVTLITQLYLKISDIASCYSVWEVLCFHLSGTFPSVPWNLDHCHLSGRVVSRRVPGAGASGRPLIESAQARLSS